MLGVSIERSSAQRSSNLCTHVHVSSARDKQDRDLKNRREKFKPELLALCAGMCAAAAELFLSLCVVCVCVCGLARSSCGQWSVATSCLAWGSLLSVPEYRES